MGSSCATIPFKHALTMGCWNKTCALSNLPIYSGDPVYVFILEENTVGNNHCHSTHLYSPVLLPFYSNYNDYGSGENSSGVGLNVVIEALKRKLIEKEVGNNEYHDIAVKREEFDEALLFRSILENRLFVENRYKKYPNQPQECAVEFVMMRKDVTDEILKNFEVKSYKKIADGNYGYVKYKFKDIIRDVDLAIKHIEEEFEKGKIRCIGLGMSLDSCLESVDSLLGDWIKFFNPFTLGGISIIVDVMEEVSNFVRKGESESAKEFLIDALKGAFIASFMENIRKSWIPQCGEGSQSIELEGHELLAKTVLNIVKKERKERKEWDT